MSQLGAKKGGKRSQKAVGCASLTDLLIAFLTALIIAANTLAASLGRTVKFRWTRPPAAA